MVWIYTIVSVVVVSLLSFVGVLALIINDKLLKRIILYLVVFSAGALLGGAIIHLLPHSFRENESATLAALS